MVFKWKEGSRVKVTPDVAAQVLNEIRESDGALTAVKVVEASRPDDAPLHDEFEWDNDKAAEAYRISQARYIIRSLVVETESERNPETRAFVKIIRSEKGTYVPIQTVIQDTDMRAELLEQARRDMKAFVQKYHSLTELCGVLDDMEHWLDVG